MAMTLETAPGLHFDLDAGTVSDSPPVADLTEASAEEVPSNIETEARTASEDRQLMADLAAAEKMCRQREDELEELKAEAKIAKELLVDAEIRLRRISSKIVDRMNGGESKDTSNTEDTSGDSPESSDNWRMLPTRELIVGLSGMGPKKFDAICELAPTVGDLEDKRGEASKYRQSFAEVLPKGCGDNIAQQIEDRLITHIAKFAVAEDDPTSEDNEVTDEVTDEVADVLPFGSIGKGGDLESKLEEILDADDRDEVTDEPADG